jgi:small subunit ribosomal protein S17e
MKSVMMKCMKRNFHIPSRGEKMGNIRTTFIKNMSKELVEKYPDDLSGDFQKNKEFLKKVIESKEIRNRIAGYIAHLKKGKKQD